MSSKRVVIIGGVAGGASAAARLRRLSESVEIVMLERGPYVSFANCGLPYHVGGEIADRDELLVQTPAGLKSRFNIDVRVNTEAVRIDRDRRVVAVMDRVTGVSEEIAYDHVVLAPGAATLMPPIPGIQRAGHFAMRTVPDAEAVAAQCNAHPGGRAVVVGGGYIGLEMAEQLHRRGMRVAVVEALPQVMAMLDMDMAARLHAEIVANGVDLHLGDGVAAFEEPGADEACVASVVVLKSGARLPADLVILGMGVRPDVALARDAGLEIGALGGIRVDEQMRTSDPDIHAVGDAVEVRHGITGAWSLLPLAGPANRQGRIAADVIAGRHGRYKASWGTGIIRVFGLTAAATGANERMLRAAGIPYETLHLHPFSHASYYPGATQIALKVLFDASTGRILGAQAIGQDGVDKRIDVLATAMQAGLTIDDLADLELAYAPPFGSAKDPVNLAGMMGQNVRAGDVALAQWSDAASLTDGSALLLDVREPGEWAQGHIPGAVHIPLGQLRQRLGELPKDKPLLVYCRSGQRSYFACRILNQNGFETRNMTGAYLTWMAASGTAPAG
jgi:NADPH-dependent 2,4-dienoyl-CoA reductase/sulfur reductase-like enzyme/rhodanese-related sulfurtransferase